LLDKPKKADDPETAGTTVDRPAPKDSKKPPAPPVFTIVKAPDLLYNDDNRLATYTGGVVLERPNMTIRSQLLRAFLRNEEGQSSSLDHAFADGRVQVVETSPDRTRSGLSDHAEYYVDEAKVILEKGHPQLVDSIKGSTRGDKLTWFSHDDRLIVDGAEGEPAVSKLRRKAHN
jgi:lipopolysaccharide export system protein LptA